MCTRIAIPKVLPVSVCLYLALQTNFKPYRNWRRLGRWQRWPIGRSMCWTFAWCTRGLRYGKRRQNCQGEHEITCAALASFTYPCSKNSVQSHRNSRPLGRWLRCCGTGRIWTFTWQSCWLRLLTEEVRRNGKMKWKRKLWKCESKNCCEDIV